MGKNDDADECHRREPRSLPCLLLSGDRKLLHMEGRKKKNKREQSFSLLFYSVRLLAQDVSAPSRRKTRNRQLAILPWEERVRDTYLHAELAGSRTDE